MRAVTKVFKESKKQLLPDIKNEYQDLNLLKFVKKPFNKKIYQPSCTAGHPLRKVELKIWKLAGSLKTITLGIKNLIYQYLIDLSLSILCYSLRILQ